MASIHFGCTIIKCEIVCDLGQNVGLDSSGSDEYLTLLLGLKSQLVFLSAFPLVPSCWHISAFRSVSTILCLLSFLGSGCRTIRRALGDRDAGVTQAHKPSSRNFVVCRRVSIAIPKHSQTSALATLSPTATAFSDTLDMSDTLKNWIKELIFGSLCLCAQEWQCSFHLCQFLKRMTCTSQENMHLPRLGDNVKPCHNVNISQVLHIFSDASLTDLFGWFKWFLLLFMKSLQELIEFKEVNTQDIGRHRCWGHRNPKASDFHLDKNMPRRRCS